MFLEAPDIPVNNDMAKRAIKPFVIGRMSRLFLSALKGAQASAMAYSVITTAPCNGLDVREYLEKLFGTGELAQPLENE